MILQLHSQQAMTQLQHLMIRSAICVSWCNRLCRHNLPSPLITAVCVAPQASDADWFPGKQSEAGSVIQSSDSSEDRQQARKTSKVGHCGRNQDYTLHYSSVLKVSGGQHCMQHKCRHATSAKASIALVEIDDVHACQQTWVRARQAISLQAGLSVC